LYGCSFINNDDDSNNNNKQLNDLVTRALVSAGVPATKEPVGLTCRDGKCPDGTTQIPWRSGKLLVWDVTVVSTLTDFYVTTARGRGEVAELAAVRKCQKYSDIPSAYTFLPIAMETLGSMNYSAYHFFEDLDRKISEVSGDSREGSFIFQRLLVTIQHFNSTLFNESFTPHDDPDL